MEGNIVNYITQIRGVSYKPSDLHDSLNKNSIILLRANNINNGKIDFEDVVYVDKSKVSETQVLRKNDILICASSGSKKLVGKAASFNESIECTFGAFCKVIRPRNILGSYLSAFFQSEYYRFHISQLANGANINNIKNEHINSFSIPERSFEEQKEISYKVSYLNGIIESYNRELDLLDELIKARFVEMFGDPRINPMNFHKSRLKDTCDIITGNTPSRKNQEYYGNYIEWIKTDNIVTNKLNPTYAKENLSKEGMDVGRIVDKNCILMACIAGSISSIGKVCVTDRKVAFNQQINAIVPKKYNCMFLYVLLQVSKEYLVDGINMALKGILSKSRLEEKQFIVPPLELQNQFASFVEEIDKSRSRIQKSLEASQELFDSLMQEYFG